MIEGKHTSRDGEIERSSLFALQCADDIIREVTIDPANLSPPNDTGTDSYARFLYQAELAVGFCVDCAAGGEILSVYLEHFEDIALETIGSWRFIQVKTRDGALGPWRLTHLIARGGAFHSLLRTHRALAGLRHYTLEVLLEGPVQRGDDLASCCIGMDSVKPDCRARIGEALGLSGPELDAFLSKVIIKADMPPRSHIRDTNLSFLGKGTNLTIDQLSNVYAKLMQKLSDSMTGTELKGAYPSCIVQPTTFDEEVKTKVAAKRLDRESLRELLASLKSFPVPLIQRITHAKGALPSQLEQKLLAGGASSRIVEDAISLRANATIRVSELLAAGGYESRLESLRESLRLRGDAVSAANLHHSQPAPQIWLTLMDTVTASFQALDPHNLMGDPLLLLGEICDLSDQCLVTWGLTSG